MLANVLAVLLASASFVFYMAAFFYPEVHRRSDFLWSGLGLFYALVLWFCAGQITGAVLLGQLTAVVLLLGLGWQTLTVRREKTPVYQQTPVVLTPEVVTDWAKNRLNQLRLVPDELVRPIRLQKRTLGESSAARLAQRLDPRRRPVYEYEFVEDGILATLSESPAALTLEALVADPPAALEPATEPDYTAPPSAEAEILSVETVEGGEAGDRSVEDRSTGGGSEAETEEALEEVVSEKVSEEVQDALAMAETDAAGDQSLAEPLAELPDVEWAAASQSGADGFTIDRSEKTRVEVAAARVEARSPGPDEEWGDALFEADGVIASSPDSQAREKPSLLAAPLILVGWVKDVITSLSKPKPVKPVIDIPRRSPPTDPPAPPPFSQSPLPDQPPPTITVEPADDPTEDDWEESNWDD